MAQTAHSRPPNFWPVSVSCNKEGAQGTQNQPPRVGVRTCVLPGREDLRQAYVVVSSQPQPVLATLPVRPHFWGSGPARAWKRGNPTSTS